MGSMARHARLLPAGSAAARPLWQLHPAAPQEQALSQLAHARMGCCRAREPQQLGAVNAEHLLAGAHGACGSNGSLCARWQAALEPPISPHSALTTDKSRKHD
jgi:hypothetical protein